MNRCLGDGKTGRDLTGGEHAATTQAVMAARQVIGVSDIGDLLQVEGFAFPGAMAALVQDRGDLAVARSIEQAVDLGDQIGLELSDLGDRQRPIKDQSALSSMTAL